MRLFYAPHTCSLSPHIVLRELAIPFELVRVDNKTKRVEDGSDFRDINPKGYVAALQLDDGRVLTEGPALLQYIADLRPDAGLAPRNGTWERVRLQEMLSFITSELHAVSSPLFNTDIPDDVRQIFRDKLNKRIDHVSAALGDQHHLMGEFGVADPYLFTVLGWTPIFGMSLERWPNITAFMDRMRIRPSVGEALRAEGIH